MSAYDILVLADPRFPGGTSTGLAAELKAQSAAGYRTALVALEGQVLRYPHPLHPAIRALVDEGAIELVDPSAWLEARLALYHHPLVFRHLPSEPLHLHAERHLLITHHPPLDGAGKASYDVAAIDANLALIAGQEVAWAPLSPIIRRQLSGLLPPERLLPFDWHNIIDPAPWRQLPRQPAGWPIRLGRHSRPDSLKWPETREAVLAAYPEDVDLEIRVLGGGAFLDTLMEGRIPANWQVLPFDPKGAPAFLAGIDFFVYYHHPKWVEAFGRTIIEAMASGCVPILPPAFEELFGDAASYAPPQLAAATARLLHASPSLMKSRREAARQALDQRFGPDAHVRRLRQLIGPPAAAPRQAPHPMPPSRRRVLFFTSNGIGMGHLTRALAIARRLPPDIEPIIATLSQALHVPADFGLHVEHLPFHAYIGAENKAWNHFLGQELSLLLAYYDPAVLIFDGNTPYAGLIEALARRPQCWAVWSRRGMWRPGSGAEALAREHRFDAVIEPGELARAFDNGPTTSLIGRTRHVAPIRLLDDSELLERDEARDALDIPRDGRAVLVQLGAGNNYDFDLIHRRVIGHLGREPGTHCVVLASPIALKTPEPPPEARLLRLFPAARYLNAFDAVVSAAGYNSFHEVMLAGIPALFVPNENPSTDNQAARAAWAAHAGMALTCRTSGHFQLDQAIDQLMSTTAQAWLRQRLSSLSRENGAKEAARIIAELTFMRRTDRPRGG